MASTSAPEDEFTPRRNPRRSCARKEPWKLDNEDENGENKDTSDIDDDMDDIDFQVYSSTTSSGQTSASNTPNTSAHINYRPRNLTPQKNKKVNKFVVDYDPDNDVFIHDGIKVNFNADTLKSHIKHFMRNSGVPAYKRSLSKCMKKIAYTTPQRRPYKKRAPPVRKKRAPREVEADLSDDTTEVVTTPSYPLKRTPESALRAMIYTRDFFLNKMAQRRKEAAAKQANKLSEERRKVNESEILKGVVAFVDVISHADEDISSVIRKELEKLGAVVVPTFTKNDPVSIILFNDGHVSTYKKAKKRGIPLVSVLWIEECRRIGAQAPADQFPAYKMERYESPAFVKELKKRKFIYASERMNPRKQRKRRGQTEQNTTPETPEHESQSATSREEASDSDLHGPAWLDEIEGSNGMMRILVNMTKVTEDQFRKMMAEPEDSENFEISPLPMRLLHKFARNLSAKKSSNANRELATPSSGTEKVTLQKKTPENTMTRIETITEKSSVEEDLTLDEDSDATESIDENDKIVTKTNETPVSRRISSRVHKVRKILTY